MSSALVRLSLAPLALLALSPAYGQVPYAHQLAPYVTSPQYVVERMLELAKLQQGETVYDLGCGDGRILITAAQQFKANAVGFELSEKRVRAAQERVARLGLQNRIKVIQGDLLTADLGAADVVTLYLITDANYQLRPRMEKYLRAGARVVSHDFAVPGWKPKWVDRSEGRQHYLIYLYEMPPVKQ